MGEIRLPINEVFTWAKEAPSELGGTVLGAYDGRQDVNNLDHYASRYSPLFLNPGMFRILSSTMPPGQLIGQTEAGINHSTLAKKLKWGSLFSAVDEALNLTQNPTRASVVLQASGLDANDIGEGFPIDIKDRLFGWTRLGYRRLR